MKKINLRKQKNNLNKIGIITIIVSIFLISIGYSAFRKDLTISNIAAHIDISGDIKINSFFVSSSSDDNSYSNSSSYTDSEINANIKLDNINSWVKYEISIVNIGNEEMGIASYLEEVLPEVITYEISDYNLKDPICDDNDSTKCTLNANKKFYITFKYKEGSFIDSNSDYSIRIKFDFQKFYNVIYSSDICVGCRTKAIANTEFSVTLSNYNKISVKIDGTTLVEGYSFNETSGLLTIRNVNGEVSIINSSYTRLEYIESTGDTDDQYINTLYKPNNTTTVIFDGMVVSGDTALFGVRESSKGIQKFTLQYVKSNYYRASYKNADFNIPSSYLINQRHIFKMNGNNVLIDNSVGTTFTSGLITNFQALDNLYLFSVNTGGSASNFGVVRLYSFKIYEEETLIKNFIPVLDSNDVPCLYETIGKTYYYNGGAGEFNYQELRQYTITNNIENISSSDSRSYVLLGDTYDTTFKGTNGRDLPTSIKVTLNGMPLTKGQDYTYDPVTGRLIIPDITGNVVISEIVSSKLDYLESTGVEYINTGYVPGINTKVVFTHIPKVTRFTSWSAFFGYRSGNTNNNSLYVSSGSNSNNASMFSAYFGGIHMVPEANIEFPHVIGSKEVITLSKNELNIIVDGVNKLSVNRVSDTQLNITKDGVTNTITTNSSTPVFTSAGPLFIFGRNIGNNTFDYGASLKLVSFQIYESDELVMDLEPILDANGDIGLIDNISKGYFYNQGSGAFLAPPS